MKASQISNLINNYTDWLKDTTVLKDIADGWVEITIPYLDRHNDYLQIYVKKNANGFVLTDGGYIIDDLEMSGCSLDSPRRQALLKTTLAGFGVEYEKATNELKIKADSDNFPIKKNNLVQAMLSVDNLFYLAKPHVASLFMEDVANWMHKHDIRYSQNIKFTGKTGYNHTFDFVIPFSKQAPERIVHTINNPTKDNAKNLIFSWQDTRESRSEDSKLYAFLNDDAGSVSLDVNEALESYQITPLNWSQRQNYAEVLAA